VTLLAAELKKSVRNFNEKQDLYRLIVHIGFIFQIYLFNMGFSFAWSLPDLDHQGPP